MKVTVCQLHNDPKLFKQDWTALGTHIKENASELVLLTELPFAAWMFAEKHEEPDVWDNGVTAHADWLERLPELGASVVIGTRPVNADISRFNEGFIWTPDGGVTSAHRKRYLPDEDGTFEATWYDRGDNGFEVYPVAGVNVAFAICSEIWAMKHMHAYADMDTHLIAAPRATEAATFDKWFAAARTAGVLAGAYCLSSNRRGSGFGGAAWVTGPDGEVLGTTTDDAPFLTVEINPTAADAAKATYPRYALRY